MIIFPAIDIMDGKPVRLFKGDFSTASQVADTVISTALDFKKCGSEWVHMVDLDGSREKKRINHEYIVEVAESSGLKVEVGGGIRTMSDIEYYIEKGISRVILGSVALSNPDLVKEAVAAFGGKIAVGIDAKNGMVATEGWLKGSSTNYIDLAKAMESVGVKTIIYTDINRDGTLTGPDIDGLVKLNEAVSCDIIASGGMSSIDDLRALRSKDLYGAICGKSIYQQKINLKEAIEVCI